MIYCLLQAWCVSVVQDPEGWALGGRDVLCVMTSKSCCHGVGLVVHSKGFSTAFRGDCPWSLDMCVALGVQVIGGKSHLAGDGCAEHCWVWHLPCRWEALQSGIGEIQSVDRWVLDLFTGRYLWHFHCKVLHHSTSVKVQNGDQCTLYGRVARCMAFLR